MSRVDYKAVVPTFCNKTVERPNKASSGTLSGHAAGEPFEKLVYRSLKDRYPDNIYKQFEFLNELYSRHPKLTKIDARKSLFNSPTVLFLLSRGDKATKEWNPTNLFEEKQDDTADALYNKDNYFDIIDVKTRNIGKKAMAPNIISAVKLAKMCSLMIDNEDYENIDIHYVEIDWLEDGEKLKCIESHYADLFKASPDSLYINWAAATQIQFHVSDLEQGWQGSKSDWAHQYIKTFVKSAKERCKTMLSRYVCPYLKYLTEQERKEIFGEDSSNISISVSIEGMVGDDEMTEDTLSLLTHH